MNAWLVRAGGNGEREPFALENNLACIGFDEIPDLSTLDSRKNIAERMAREFPNWKPGAINNRTGQLITFLKKIQIGDVVVLPRKGKSMVAVGKITGDYQYAPKNGPGATHVRPVEWLNQDVPRPAIGQDLKNSLGAFMTVCRLKSSNAAQRLLSLADGKGDPHADGITILLDEDEDDGDTPSELDIEQVARDQIITAINARFKNHELTRLVDEILKAEGYTTFRSPPGPDDGVDIVAGRGPLGFERPRLCVQVKSSGSPVDITILQQVQGAMSTVGADQGLLVSWGGFKGSYDKKKASTFFKVRLWEADDLLTALFRNYDNLDDDLKSELPLKRIWTLVQDAEDA